MGLEEGKTGQAEEGQSKCAERIRPDELQDGRFQIGFRGSKKSLPFPAVFLEELLPTEEGLLGDIKDLADLLHGTQPEGMLRQDTEDEEQAVPAVRDDRIRKHGVRGRVLTLPADQAADAQTDLYRPAIDKLDQGPGIGAVYPPHAPAPAERTDL